MIIKPRDYQASAVQVVKQHRIEGYGNNFEALPKSRVEADNIGSAYFYTGRACKAGHVASRFAKGGSCTWCARAQSAAKYGRTFNGASSRTIANEERASAIRRDVTTYTPTKPCPRGHRLRFVASTNCVECDKASRVRRAEKAKDVRIQKLYGLSPERHQSLFDEQGQRCAICPTTVEHRRELHVDHCHKTNVVRGLLCSCCNQGIGLFKDNPKLMTLAAEYVGK